MSLGQETRAVSILGIPFDANSRIFEVRRWRRRGSARRCNDSSNMWTEDGIDLGGPGTIHDAGDLELPNEAVPAFDAIEQGVREVLALDHPLVCLGGDHSITYPILRGFNGRFPNLTVLHFDAHPDLYHDYDGRLSHACQFSRVMEEKLARRLVQVGIRTINRHQLEQATKFGVEVIAMRNIRTLAALKLDGPLFISFGVDVLDPGFAPGVSHHEPGGMSVREVIDVIQHLQVPVVGADIVEYNPIRDHFTQTAMVCVKVLKEIAAVMLRDGSPSASEWV